MHNFDGWDDIETIASKVNAGKIKALGLVNESFKRIDATKEYNAILAVAKSRAIERAKQIDQKVKNGQNAGRLAGVPFIAKDNFLTFGTKTTASSHILANFEAPFQATAINKLEAEGAIMVAKANLDSFAHGGSTENSAFGPTLNPIDKTRVPGGSSGGSGASIALKLAPFALGTDTGGSIRLPASFCGVLGYKPTYGLISRYGVVAMASSTDVIGPLASSTKDIALLIDIMSGVDSLDSTTIENPENHYNQLKNSLKGLKVGVIKELLTEDIDQGVAQAVKKQIAVLKDNGAEIIEVSIPSIDLALACYYIIVPAEVSSNLMRYDGQRYGLHDDKAKDLLDSYQLAREQGFESENKRRIMIGTYVLSSGYYDAYYKKAQTVRTKLIEEFNQAFKQADILLSPTAPFTAFKLGQNTADPLQMYLADIMTVSVNLVGIPAISMPAGDSNGLPVGIQFMAPQKADKHLLEFATAYEGIS